MSIKKKQMNWMMLCKLPLGASLWAILFFFIFTACQDDLPYEDTEVMMTFTTRAVVTQDKENDAIDVEKMDNLRVIVVRENGDIVYNDTEQVGGEPIATVSFQTPVKTGGENFKFFAIANEDGILPTQNLGNIQSGNIEALKTCIVGNGSEFSINNAIPQTKYWTAKVNPYESLSVSQQLDYLVSKISVQFKNETNKAQSLSNIHITGITPNGKGRLFNHPTGEKDNEGEEIYEEVYVTTNDVTLNNGIAFDGVTDLPSGESSAIKHYYTYPVDAGNISSPTLYATWNEQTYTLPLEGFAELKHNDHLKIIVTLTGQELVVNYTIAPWNTENSTNIGSPTIGGGYNTEDWTAGGDVNIGGDPVEPNPGGGNGGGDAPIDGSVLWNGTETLNWSNLPINCKAFNDLGYVVTTDYKIRIYYNTIDNGQTPQLQFLNASEQGMGIPELNNSNSTNITIGSTSFEFSINEAMLNNFLKKEDSTVAFYVRGYQLIITKVLLFLPSTE